MMSNRCVDFISSYCTNGVKTVKFNTDISYKIIEDMKNYILNQPTNGSSAITDQMIQTLSRAVSFNVIMYRGVSGNVVIRLSL